MKDEEYRGLDIASVVIEEINNPDYLSQMDPELRERYLTGNWKIGNCQEKQKGRP